MSTSDVGERPPALFTCGHLWVYPSGHQLVMQLPNCTKWSCEIDRMMNAKRFSGISQTLVEAGTVVVSKDSAPSHVRHEHMSTSDVGERPPALFTCGHLWVYPSGHQLVMQLPNCTKWSCEIDRMMNAKRFSGISQTLPPKLPNMQWWPVPRLCVNQGGGRQVHYEPSSSVRENLKVCRRHWSENVSGWIVLVSLVWEHRAWVNSHSSRATRLLRLELRLRLKYCQWRWTSGRQVAGKSVWRKFPPAFLKDVQKLALKWPPARKARNPPWTTICLQKRTSSNSRRTQRVEENVVASHARHLTFQIYFLHRSVELARHRLTQVKRTAYNTAKNEDLLCILLQLSWHQHQPDHYNGRHDMCHQLPQLS